jgi:hypothetical protein
MEELQLVNFNKDNKIQTFVFIERELIHKQAGVRFGLANCKTKASYYAPLTPSSRTQALGDQFAKEITI